MESYPPPRKPEEKDEVLTLLERLEKWLLGVIHGLVVFFFHRIPKWTLDLLHGVWEFLLSHCERLVRIVVKLVRISVLTAVLATIVIGPGVAIYKWLGQKYIMIWGGVIAIAILFALQHRLRKAYERRKRERLAREAGLLKCGHCATVHSGTAPPVRCRYCNEVWVEKVT